MTSGVVSVRLPEELFEKLTERANAENKKISDLVRELLESNLKPGGSADNSAILERLNQLEEAITTLVSMADENAMTRIDSVIAKLDGHSKKSVQAAAEARYFARLAVMYGIDIAHYVAQKTEIGVVPKPPDKDDKDKQLSFHEKKCKEYAAGYSGGGKAEKEAH